MVNIEQSRRHLRHGFLYGDKSVSNPKGIHKHKPVVDARVRN